MQIGKPVYSSDRRPIFEDVGMPEGKRTEMVVRIGERFRMGNSRIGYSDYILRSFDEKKSPHVIDQFKVTKIGEEFNKSGTGDLSVLMTTYGDSGRPNIDWMDRRTRLFIIGKKVVLTPIMTSARKYK